MNAIKRIARDLLVFARSVFAQTHPGALVRLEFHFPGNEVE